MATHSNIPPWRIPWTEKPGRLQSIRSHRVGHYCSNLAYKQSNLCCVKRCKDTNGLKVKRIENRNIRETVTKIELE